MVMQEGWRWCQRCQVLAFGGHGDGVCHDGGPHDFSASGRYSVPLGESPPGAQEGWRWCQRCQVLAFGGHGDGVCHDGGPHDFSASGRYSVPLGESPPGAQDGWRWCSRCQDLVFGGHGTGRCHDGRRHYLDDSGAYSVPLEAARVWSPVIRPDLAAVQAPTDRVAEAARRVAELKAREQREQQHSRPD